jgi:hypothetical protein
MADAKQEMTWTTVSDEAANEPETKIVFDQVGDEFTGKYLGMRMVEPSDPAEQPYRQARFERAEGELFFTNTGHSLRTGLKDVRVGSMVRITYTDNLDTGQASPMRIFRVEVGRLSRNT